MTQLKLNAWIGLVVFALAAPPAYAGEEVVVTEEGEAAEADESPLNLSACAALLALTPGQWVIVDDKELRRVPGWAEERDEEDSEFTGLPECARRIGLPPESGALPSRTEPEPRERTLKVSTLRAPRRTEILVPLETRLDEQGTWKEPISWNLPGPRLVVPATPVVVSAETPITPTGELPSDELPAPERTVIEYVEGWNLLAGLNYSLGRPRSETAPAPEPIVPRSSFNVLGTLFGNLPVLAPDEATSLTPRLDASDPAPLALAEREFTGLTTAQFAEIQRRSRSVSKDSPTVPILLAGAVPDVAVPETVVFTRSSDAAYEEAPAGPTPQPVALPEPTVLALVGLGLLSAVAVRVRS